MSEPGFAHDLAAGYAVVVATEVAEACQEAQNFPVDRWTNTLALQIAWMRDQASAMTLRPFHWEAITSATTAFIYAISCTFDFMMSSWF